jgi:glycosyltransferase involved in cell wall biosynthesis
VNIDVLVSIVLPTYNGSKFLEESIRSCLDQSYSNFELILTDDASEDSTPEIIAHFERLDSRIRSVRHTSNLGLPAALNSGFAISRGQLLTWTSDDNLYRPDALAVLVDFMKCNPEFDIVYAGFSYVNDQGKVIGRHPVLPVEELTYRNTVGACFLYRRSVYEKIGGYDVNAVQVEDYDFWLRAFKSFRFHALAEDLYFYRVHTDSLSYREIDRTKLATRQILEKYLCTWKGKDRSFAYLRLARDAAEMNDSKAAWIYFAKGILQHPFCLVGRISWVTFLALILPRRHFQILKSLFKMSPGYSNFRK